MPTEIVQVYDGLYEVQIGDNPTVRIVIMRDAREGAMREFFDPETGDYVGCCGCNWAAEHVKRVEGS